MEGTSNLDLNVNATIRAKVEIDEKQTESELDKLFETIQQKLKETTTREIGEYATAAGKAVSDSWDSAKETVTSTGGEAISDTLSAIFSGEMDKVQDIWDKAWIDMGDGLEKTWESLLSTLGNKAMEGLGDILQESVLDPISDFLETTVWEPFKDWGLGLLGEGLDWLGLGDLGKILGIGSSAKTGTGADSVVGLAQAGKSAYEAYSFVSGAPAMMSSGAAAVEALGAASQAGVLGEGIAAAIESIFSGADMATSIYSATGYAQTALAEAQLAAEMAEIYSGMGLEFGAVSELATGGAAASEAASATGLGFSIGPGMATAGIFAAAELFAMAMGEPGPTAILAGAFADAFGMSDKNEMTAEEAQHIVGYQAQTLATQATAAASGDWSTEDNTVLNGLAFAATQRYGAGNSIASVGGISTEDIEAQVAALGPYAQALYDVQTITWEVSDALMAYNDAAERGIFMAQDQAEEFRAMALELGITEAQYQALTDAGLSYDQIASAVTDTAGDLRIAMLDMGGAIERAAAETGMGADQADDYASKAAELWREVQAGITPLRDFDLWLEDTAISMGLGSDEASSLTSRLENMLAATNQATGGASSLTDSLTEMAAQNTALADSTLSVASSVFDLSNLMVGATDATADLTDSSGVMSATFTKLAVGLDSVSSSAKNTYSALSDLNMVGGSGSGSGFNFTYHTGGMAGLPGWPRFHTGLLPDELPAVLQRGEAIIQRSAVNSETLPVLKRINDTGLVPATSGGVSVHVEVHGNVLGDGDGMEELARIIDRRLRRIDSARYSM